jgi:hypothetical protein
MVVFHPSGQAINVAKRLGAQVRDYPDSLNQGKVLEFRALKV